METDRGETLGEFLKREREGRLVSIRAAARAVGVEPNQIEALESDDVRAFPDREDLREILVLYAKFLLLDETQLLRRMGHTRSQRHRETANVSLEPGNPPRPPGRRLTIIAWVVGAALLLVGVCVLVWAPPDLVRKEEREIMRYLAPEPSGPPRRHRGQDRRQPGQQALPPPGMRYYDKIEAFRRVEFNSEQEAIAAGYQKAPR
jgi:transcriptional regulator with XRE-family HTH domain